MGRKLGILGLVFLFEIHNIEWRDEWAFVIVVELFADFYPRIEGKQENSVTLC